MRIRLPWPLQPRKVRFPRPRRPASGQSEFWQQRCSMGCIWIRPDPHERGTGQLCRLLPPECLSDCDESLRLFPDTTEIRKIPEKSRGKFGSNVSEIQEKY